MAQFTVSETCIRENVFSCSLIHLPGQLFPHGILVYGSAAKMNLRKIQNTQRRIIMTIFVNRRFESIANLLVENRMLTVFEFFIEELVKELFKHLHNETP